MSSPDYDICFPVHVYNSYDRAILARAERQLPAAKILPWLAQAMASQHHCLVGRPPSVTETFLGCTVALVFTSCFSCSVAVFLRL